VICGLCANYALFYYIDANPAVNLTYQKSCGLDEAECRFNVEGPYKAGSEWICWYNKDDPTKVRFDGIPKVNVAAWVFFGIFAFCLAAVIAVWVIYPLYKIMLVGCDALYSSY
jgi:hypothetical protein